MSLKLSQAERFPPLPYLPWARSKLTLHLFLQIVGKLRLALTHEKAHWWNVTLHPTACGLSTGPIAYGGSILDIEFDFLQHLLRIRTSRGGQAEFHLKDTSVAAFYNRLFAELKSLGVEAKILARPFDNVGELPFAKDHDNAHYDPEAVARYWRALIQAHNLLYEFSARFSGKATPVHFFWHSMDIAYTRFSGRKADPPLPGDARVSDRNAYSHEVISFGFWPGDPKFGEAAFYAYAFPSPAGLAERRLEPASAEWVEQNGAPLAILRYDDVRGSSDPRRSVLDFCESVYQHAAELAGWERDELNYAPYWQREYLH